MKNNITRRTLLGFAFAAGALGTLDLASVPVFAHEADCPYCLLPVPQDTPEQDNEVKMRYGRKRLEYRCVYCALKEAQSAEFKDGDIVIGAPSETKGSPILIMRTGGKWSSPAGILFAAKKMSHRVCHITYRAFRNQKSFDAWVKAHPDEFEKDAKPITLAEMLELSKPFTK